MDPILDIRSLRKKYEEFELEGISLSLDRGVTMGLIGPNGAGKTTTINLIMNFIQPDAGEVQVFGLKHPEHTDRIKDRIGYVGEEQYFYTQRSAHWTGRFVSHFFRSWDQKRYLELLDRFKLPGKKMIKKFSRGMKVKLSLAIALSHDPDLILLDEPTSGLDPVMRREVMDLLHEVTQQNDKSVLFSSHLTDDVSRVADKIAFLINGNLHLCASKDELMTEWKRIHFTKGSLDEATTETLIRLEEHMFGSTGITNNFSAIKGALSQGLDSGNIKIENVGLDDILIELVKGK